MILFLRLDGCSRIVSRSTMCGRREAQRWNRWTFVSWWPLNPLPECGTKASVKIVFKKIKIRIWSAISCRFEDKRIELKGSLDKYNHAYRWLWSEVARCNSHPGRPADSDISPPNIETLDGHWGPPWRTCGTAGSEVRGPTSPLPPYWSISIPSLFVCFYGAHFKIDKNVGKIFTHQRQPGRPDRFCSAQSP